MQENENIIAKKYATAFLNIYGSQFSLNEIMSLTFLSNFFRKNRYFYVSLEMSTISFKTKETAITKVVKGFKFKTPIKKLILTLLKHGRIEIIEKVLESIWYQFKKIYNIEKFIISTSYPIIKKHKSIIVKLLTTMTNKQVLTQFITDQSLIVGVRMESSEFLWERSIKKELMMISKFIAKKGIPCE